MTTAHSRLRRAAQIALLVAFCCIVFPVVTLFQLRYQLVSPIIPESLIHTIGRPYLYNAIMAAVFTAIAVSLFMVKRYWWVIGTVLVIVIWQRYGTLGFEG